MTDANALPPPQDLSSEHVIEELSRYGMQRLRDTSVPQILVLSVLYLPMIVRPMVAKRAAIPTIRFARTPDRICICPHAC